MQEINPEILSDAQAPVPPSKEIPEPSSAPKKGGCADPNCPVCRWSPIVGEILENIAETDTFHNMVEMGYPVGLSLALLPDRMTEAHSVSMMEMVEGMEESLKGDKHVVIPNTRVADILDPIKTHLEESDDLLTLVVLNDRMLVDAVTAVGVLLDPDAPESAKLEAKRWYSRMTRPSK